MPISATTRRSLLDEMVVGGVSWSGQLSEPDFLARLYDLASMPSFDGRFSNARDDIWKHQVMNRDWDDFWVFTDSRFNLLYADDAELLGFLAETVHPVVRPDSENAKELVDLYNRYLRSDGYELHVVTDIVGRPVYGARSLTVGVAAVEQLRSTGLEVVDHAYLSRQITRIETSVVTDPELAIGTAKELLETVAKTILNDRSAQYASSDDLPALLKKVRKELRLTPADIDGATRAADVVRQLYSNLGSVVQSLAELRNLFGTGHGRAIGTDGLTIRHARLAAGSAVTLATFLLETHEATHGERGGP